MFAHIVSTASLLSLASAAELDAGFTIPTQPSIPANCISWNDGCNTCRVVNGVIGGCTEMMCRQQGTPFCIAYDYSATPTVVDKPTAPPAVAELAQASFCEDSRPQLCRMMCQPPSCPMGQCAMRTDSCCEFTCQAPTPPEPPAPASTPTIPDGCVSWHDGCNTCMVQNGQVTACTMMMCFEQVMPHCLAFDRDHRH